MASSGENSLDKIGSPTNFDVSSEPNSSAGSEAICNHRNAMNLVRINNDQKDIFIASLKEQIYELKQDKAELKQEKMELKHEKIGLQETNSTLNRQMHEMRERLTEINKFHGGMNGNMSARCETEVWWDWNESEMNKIYPNGKKDW